MWKETTLISALVCLGFISSPQDGKKADQEKAAAEFKVPPEEASRKNPVATSPSAIAEGKRRYGIECGVCHGNDGDGKGDLVEELKLKLRDWRDPAALKDFTDGGLFYIINKGKGVMPGEEGRAKPEQIWQMVIYLRSLAKNEPQAKPNQEPLRIIPFRLENDAVHWQIIQEMLETHNHIASLTRTPASDHRRPRRIRRFE